MAPYSPYKDSKHFAAMPVITRFASCWKFLYSPPVHGVSIRTFYRQCRSFPGPSIIVVEDTSGAVFGGFATNTWEVASKRLHYGMHDCFVFRFPADEDKDDDGTIEVFPWTGRNEHFMYADLNGFGMGSGGSFAFWLQADFLKGMSTACDTFGNDQPLSAEPEFIVRTFECWTFDSSAAAERSSSPIDSESQDRDALWDCMSPEAMKSARSQQLREQAAYALRYEAFL